MKTESSKRISRLAAAGMALLFGLSCSGGGGDRLTGPAPVTQPTAPKPDTTPPPPATPVAPPVATVAVTVNTTPATFGTSTLVLRSALQIDSVVTKGEAITIKVDAKSPQVLVATDSIGRPKAFGISLPGGVTNATKADVVATLETMFMLAPGFPHATSADAAVALSRLEQMSCFTDLVNRAKPILASSSLSGLMADHAFTAAFQGCEQTYFATPPSGMSRALISTMGLSSWGMPTNGIEADMIGNAGDRSFRIRNYAYRSVDIYRRARNADGSWTTPIVRKVGLGGAAEMGWGSVFTWSVASPSSYEDGQAFDYPAVEAEYWVIGPSLMREQYETPPFGVPGPSFESYFWTYWSYGASPIVTAVLPAFAPSCATTVLSKSIDVVGLKGKFSNSKTASEITSGVIDVAGVVLDVVADGGFPECFPSAQVSKSALSTILKAVGLGFGSWNITGMLSSLTETQLSWPYRMPLDPYKLAIASGESQTANTSMALAQPLVARLTDAGGDPVVGAEVYWSTKSGGSFPSRTTHTDAQGRASNIWTLGSTAGAQVAQAEAFAVEDMVVFHATALAVATNGNLGVTITGLPTGTNAAVVVTGPGNFSRAVTATTDLGSVVAGTYVVTASPVTTNSQMCTPAPASQNVTLAASATINATVAYTCVNITGTFNITIAGLPTGTNAAVTVTGPSNFSRSLTASTNLGTVAAGAYVITANTVATSTQSCSASPATQNITVAANANMTATITYICANVATIGSLGVTVNGLTAGVNAAITVTGPNSFARVVTATTNLGTVATGTYTVTASPVTTFSATCSVTPTTQNVTVVANTTAGATVTYNCVAVVTDAAFNITVNGLPTGISAVITVTGPNAYSRSVTGSGTLGFVTPGQYTVTANSVTTSTQTCSPAPAVQNITVVAGVNASATVAYACVTNATTGSLGVTVSGLPTGVNAAVAVLGPNSYSRTLTGTTNLGTVATGTYTVTASPVTTSTQSCTAMPATQNVTVSTNTTTAVTVPYTCVNLTGSLGVTVNGLPTSMLAVVTVTGPNSFTRSVTGTVNLGTVPVGTYTVTASPVSNASTSCSVAPTTQNVNVTANTSVGGTVTYTCVGTTGSLGITINGLPTGLNAAVTVTGPSSFSRTVTATTNLGTVAVGTYTVAASPVSNSGVSCSVLPTTQNVNVTSNTTVGATVTYMCTPITTTGILGVTITGLPTGTSAAVTVTGPGGFSRSVTATGSLGSVPTSTYTITASVVNTATQTCTPTPLTQNVNVTANASVGGTISYACVNKGGTIHFTVNGLTSGINPSVLVSNGSYSGTWTGGSDMSVSSGTYTVTTQQVQSTSQVCTGGVNQTVTVTAGGTTNVTVTYSCASLTGNLSIAFSGLPTGVMPQITIFDANNNQYSNCGTATSPCNINGVPNGIYSVRAYNVLSGGKTYIPTPGQQNVTVVGGQTATASVTYQQQVTNGQLTVTISGLFSGQTATFTVNGSSYSLGNGSQTVSLPSGTYTVSVTGPTGCVVTQNVRSITVPSGGSASTTFAFTCSGGTMVLNISGTPASVTVSGPGGYSITKTASATLSNLAPGSYTVFAANTSTNTQDCTPSPKTQSPNVTAGGSVTVSVTYTCTTRTTGGALSVSYSGLPAGATPQYTLFTSSNSVVGSGTSSNPTVFNNLAPGSYSLRAYSVTFNGRTYNPTATNQSVTITAGQTTSKTITYQ